MPKSNQNSRRGFISKVAKGVVGASLLPTIITAADRQRNIELLSREKEKYSANDQIQLAVIGAGGMGTADTNTAITVPGVKLVAACDLYDGRLADAKKKWGNDLYTTRDYREILERSDIDAVIIATPDFWHKDISVAAMNKGKSV
ncbi:MAG TPA: Gfo/Idh/MocA family oxidoreductase [Chitinophaga sp.]